MTKITLEEAAARTLGDVVAQACARRETLVVTGPGGEIARIVPALPPAGRSEGRTWRGHPVRSAADLAGMSPDELKAAGWSYPDESGWVESLAESPEAGADRCE